MMPETHAAQNDAIPRDQHAEGEADRRDEVPDRHGAGGPTTGKRKKGDSEQETVPVVEPEPVVERGDPKNLNTGG